MVFCAVSVRKSRTALSVSLDLPERIRQGKKKSGKLTLLNAGAFPLFSVKGTICCALAPAEDADGAETAAQEFSCSLSAYRKEEITVKLNSACAGVAHVWVKELTVGDLLGIFCYQPDISGVCADVTITPAPVQVPENEAQVTETPADEAQAAEVSADEAQAAETPAGEVQAADAENKQEKSDE